MPGSPVEFRNGQSLAVFTDRYGSADPDAWLTSLEERGPQGFECPVMRAQTLLPS